MKLGKKFLSMPAEKLRTEAYYVQLDGKTQRAKALNRLADSKDRAAQKKNAQPT
jgi:hypothetical protein